MTLAKYKQKRNFKVTSEPAGSVKKKSGKALMFVVQKHQASHLHYDFRLEMEGVLKSWAVPKGPSLNPDDKRLAMMVEDHPFDYRDFEGTIPEGNYGAGTVMVWDTGTYYSIESNDPKESEKALLRGLHKGHITFVLDGEKLKGEFALIKIKNQRSAKDNAWLLVKADDEYAAKKDVTKDGRSAASGKSLDEIAHTKRTWGSNKKAATIKSAKRVKKNFKINLDDAQKAKFPHQIKPMLAKLGDKPFDDPNWLFEIKWDGFRAIAEIEKGKISLYSRNFLSFNEMFAQIVQALKFFGHDAVLDGEVVVLDKNGKPQFQLLQNFTNSGGGQLTYMVFDILYLDGHDLTSLPLARRKEILKEVLPESNFIKYSAHIRERGKDFFQLIAQQNMEGIFAKDARSPYRAGRRSSEWLKIKTHMRQEAVIAGYTEPRGSRKELGALILGLYDDQGQLQYIGHTGGGLNQKNLQQLKKLIAPYKIDKSPFAQKFRTNAPATWVKPKFVCEVQFQEWTDAGTMRQPIFLGLRPDKDPREARREFAVPKEKAQNENKQAPLDVSENEMAKSKETILKIGKTNVPVTNLDKVFWLKEKYTKGDLINYYREAAPFILTYLKDRPESLNRYPNGIKGKSFFQKDVDHQFPAWIKTKEIFSESNGKNINYMLCQDEATLVYMANLGCIEINPWNSRIQKLDYPDFFVIDLDPGENSFNQVIEVAQTVHKVLDQLEIEGYCKTSGATGLHVYVPLGAKYAYDQAKQFAEIIAHLVHEQIPAITSIERATQKRKKKIYLDFLQNRKGQTLAAPYSVRPRDAAPVSTPLEWKEVKKGLDPRDFTIKNIFKRLDKKGDLWQPVLGKGVDIKKVLKKIGATD